MFEIYGRNNCVWCNRAKTLLDDWGLPYTYYNIEEDEDALLSFKEYFPGAKTVPMICFENDKYGWETIGGYEDLHKYLTGPQKDLLNG